MTMLQPGDLCPCCGQPIKTQDPDALMLLSWIAWLTGDKPEKSWPEEDKL